MYFCQQNNFAKPLTNPKKRSIIQFKSRDEDTKKRNVIQESADKVRAAYEQRFFTASELREGKKLPTVAPLRLNEVRIFRMNSGGITVYNRPVELIGRGFFYSQLILRNCE